MRPRHILALLTPLLALAVALPASATPPSPPRLEKTLVLGEWRATPGPMAALTHPETLFPEQLNRLHDPEIWLRIALAHYNGADFDILWLIGNSVGHLEPPTIIPLTAGPGDDIAPRLSPDVSTVIFSSNRSGKDYDLYRVPTSGGEPAIVAGGPGHQLFGSWSPDGRRIVFSSNHEGDYEIYVAQADGAGLTRLTANAAADSHPAWSPDGRTIIWARRSGESGAVWAMSADGRNQRALTGQLRFLGPPLWSPDGSRIAFDYDADGDGFNYPALMAANGTGLRAFWQVPTDDGYKYDLLVNAWSPEGERLVTEVNSYNLLSGKPFLDDHYVGRLDEGLQGLTRLYYSQMAFYPDTRSIDQQAPATALNLLPAYKRAGPLQLSLTGNEVGTAGIRSYELQARRNGGTWSAVVTGTLDALSSTISETLTYAGGSPGDVVDLRARATDDAGNRGPLAADGETRVTLFATQATGRITDNRGYPTVATLGLAPTSVGPATSDSSGRYLARTATTGVLTVSPTAPGLKSPPATALDMATDRIFDVALLPGDDLLGDGSFESGSLGGWRVTGSLPAPQVVGQAFTGAKALRLGATCAEPCFSDPSPIGEGVTAGQYAVSDAGDEHLVYYSSQSVSYVTRPADGAWSTPQTLVQSDSRGSVVARDLLVADDGSLHLVYFFFRTDKLTTEMFHRSRSAAGVWSSPFALGPTTNSAHLFGGKGGRVMAVVNCDNTNGNGCPSAQTPAYTRVFTPAAGWGPARRLSVGSSVFSGALGPDGVFQVAWNPNYEGVVLTKIDASGREIDSQTVPNSTSADSRAALAIDGHGTTHIFWGVSVSDTVGARHSVCLAGLSCSPPQVIGPAAYDVAVIADHQGGLHLLDRFHYWRLLPNGTLSTPVATNPGNLFADYHHIAIDGADRIYTFADGKTRSTLTTPAAGASALTRQVNIPATMHRPTLSFAYSLGRVTGGSGMRILADDGSGPEAVFTRTTPAPWGLGWADLTPYAGKTVTLTIALDQAANASPVELLLDDVALGSWKTPLLESATPLELSALKPSTLTISGTNFLDGAQVLLGATPVTGVELVGETTLRASVPAGIKPGLYRLTVVNPGGARAAIDGIVVGERRFAPLVVR